jgi:hypothetical protein
MHWLLAAYLGASFTAPSTLTVNTIAVRGSYPDVRFHSDSFRAPQYYGYRVAWFPSETGSWGIEGEMIHLKVYAEDGALGPSIERFWISHGLNLVLVNAVWRQRGDRRVRMMARGGAGFSVPHAESTILGAVQEQYEVGSMSLQAALGPEVRLAPHVVAFGEYKVTTVAPAVSVVGGTIKGRYTSQHLVFGLGTNW